MYNKLQKEKNGPLVPAIRSRIKKVYETKNMSLAELGERFEFSGTFIRGIMLDGDEAYRVNSKHSERILRVLTALEHEIGIGEIVDSNSQHGNRKDIESQAVPQAISNSPDLAQLIKQIYEMGFEVSLKPRQS